jgi:hypothetical protein
VARAPSEPPQSTQSGPVLQPMASGGNESVGGDLLMRPETPAVPLMEVEEMENSSEVCDLCRRPLETGSTTPNYGHLSYVFYSNLLLHMKKGVFESMMEELVSKAGENEETLRDFKADGEKLFNLNDLHIGKLQIDSCRHVVHVECGQNTTNAKQFFLKQTQNGDFICDLCKFYANTILPLHSHVAPAPAPALAVPPQSSTPPPPAMLAQASLSQVETANGVGGTGELVMMKTSSENAKVPAAVVSKRLSMSSLNLSEDFMTVRDVLKLCEEPSGRFFRVKRTFYDAVNDIVAKKRMKFYKENEKTLEKSNTFASSFIHSVREMISNTIQNIDLSGVEYYIQAQLPFARDTLESLRASIAKSSGDYSFTSDLAQNLKLVNHLLLMLQIGQLRDPSRIRGSFNEILLENNAENMLFYTLFYLLLLNDDIVVCPRVFLSLSRYFTLVRAVQIKLNLPGRFTFSTIVELTRARTGTVMEGFLHDLQNYECRMQVIMPLLPFIRKVFALLVVFFDVAPEITELVKGNTFCSDLEESEFYFNHFSLGISNEHPENIARFGTEIEEWTKRLCERRRSKPYEIIMSTVPVMLSLPEFPQNFKEFHIKYSAKTCTMCGEFKGEGPLAMCLICGVCMCSIRCIKNPLGLKANLSYHTDSEHCGQSFFVIIESSQVLIIDCPRAMRFEYLYTNKFGQTPDPETRKDLTSYVLDIPHKLKIYDIILKNRITQETTLKIFKTQGKHFQDFTI